MTKNNPGSDVQHPLFFNYALDCELPPDGRFGGPATWEVAESSVRGFVEIMAEFGCAAGTTLFVYPDVARRQQGLYREMAAQGVEIALHLHGLRYSKIKEPAWLGAMSYERQLEIYRVAKADLEEIVGQPCLGYKACYLSANDFTFPALVAAGFVWSGTSGAGRYWPENYSCWAGAWPYPYHPSPKNKCVPGPLPIYEIPRTRGRHIFHQNDPARPLDLRAETTPEIAGPAGRMFRAVIAENLEEMARRNQPVRVIMSASHNTNPFADRASFQYRNVEWVCRTARELGTAAGYVFTPAPFLRIRDEGLRLDAF